MTTNDTPLDTRRLQRIQAASLQEHTGTEPHDLFHRVVTASEAYVLRFGGRLTTVGTAMAARREFAELQEAIAEHQMCQDGVIVPIESLGQSAAMFKQNVALELIDTFVTLGGMAREAGLTWADIEQAAHDKLSVLEARTEADYVWHEPSLSVVKRSKLEGK